MGWDLFSAAHSARTGDPAGAPPTPVRALSPATVNALAREILEEALPPLWVAGEVTGWKRHRPSGHCYFSLRDARAQLRCVMFESDARLLPTDPEEGMRLRALGVLTVYERRGEFQLRVQRVEGEEGDGLWRLAFERLKGRLEAEGLLAPERKRALPRLPEAVGVVTSPVGAALHDILRVLRARAPWTRVVFSPARVQGPGAAGELARAIRRFSTAGAVQVLIVGRGGGSAEDLWAFNEESVVRAIAASAVPVVSAVGHETDVTLSDLVADVRAATPSAAAELVVPDADALRRELQATGARLRGALGSRRRAARRELAGLEARLAGMVRERQRRRVERLRDLGGRLHALSPLAVLSRGYAVPLGDGGRVLRRRTDFAPGRPFRLRVTDGAVDCRAEEGADG